MVHEHKVIIIECFEDIEMQDAWSANDKMAAIGYKNFLRKFETIFVLKLFSSVFASSNILYNLLLTNPLDVIFVPAKSMNFMNIYNVNEIHSFNFCGTP